MRKIRQILDYRLSKGISAEQTALALSISKGTAINAVRRFERSGLTWPLPDGMTDTALESALFPPVAKESKPPGMPTGADKPLPDISYVIKELSRPHMTLQRLWEEYREQYPDGLRRSAYYRYVLLHRPPKVNLKMIHKGGDLLFSDYSGDGLEYIDRSNGEVVALALFVTAWGASSYSYAEATRTQKTPDFSLSHVRSFEYFDAVPHGVVIDNLKSGVQKADRYDPIANPLFEQMARHYQVAVLPARVRKPQDKAVVESAVLQVQRFILARLRNRQFFSPDEVNAAVREELEILNNRPMKDYGGQTRKQRFLELDKPYARKLPRESFKISRVKLSVRVAPNYHVRFEDHHYSLPHHLAGQCVDIYQVGSIIEIYHDNVHLCRHPAGPPNFGYTTSSAHMPPNHAFVKGWSRDWFIKKASEIGPATAEAVQKIMASREHVQQGFNAAMGVLRLTKVYSSDRVEKACQRILHFKAVSFKTLKTVLEQHLDAQTVLPLQAQTPEPPLLHENIRGPEYYAQSAILQGVPEHEQV